MSVQNQAPSIAVVLHLTNLDMWPAYWTTLKQLPFSTSFFVSTTTDKKEAVRQLIQKDIAAAQFFAFESNFASFPSSLKVDFCPFIFVFFGLFSSFLDNSCFLVFFTFFSFSPPKQHIVSILLCLKPHRLYPEMSQIILRMVWVGRILNCFQRYYREKLLP